MGSKLHCQAIVIRDCSSIVVTYSYHNALLMSSGALHYEF